ncbi:MAG: hypothetical protein LUH14_03290 [Clostridiaceae bacterium]|nr:hypothetical protein [Clostridiaceae bacterium]
MFAYLIKTPSTLEDLKKTIATLDYTIVTPVNISIIATIPLSHNMFKEYSCTLLNSAFYPAEIVSLSIYKNGIFHCIEVNDLYTSETILNYHAGHTTPLYSTTIAF